MLLLVETHLAQDVFNQQVVSKAKFFTTRQLEWCASEAMQILGGAGYLRGSPVERVYREVKVMAIGGGSEEIMRDLAARQLSV